MPDLSELIEATVIEDEAHKLCASPTEMEVKEATFAIPIDSSPGPDEFGSGFFTKCWDIVKDDVILAIQEFLTIETFLVSIHRLILLLFQR